MMETIKGIRTAEGVAQIDYDALSNKPVIVNPNLLDNWYFGNPVNQRGQTAYTGGGYTIDRWLDAYNPNNFTVLIGDEGLSTNGEDISGPFIMQRFTVEFYKSIAGRQLTFSVLTSNGLYSGTAIFPAYGETDVAICDTADTFMYFQYSHNSANLPCVAFVMRNANIKYIAAKLELGDTQTLAHKDANGNWVLNEIPNYDDQLARCQRYFQIFRTETERKTYCEDFRPTMRTTDSGEVAKSTITINGVTYYTATADL